VTKKKTAAKRPANARPTKRTRAPAAGRGVDPSYPHLNPATRTVMARSEADRIAWTQLPRLVSYSRYTDVMQVLEDLLTHPRVSRMPHLLLVADSNNGKTSICEKFVEQHPARDNPAGDYVLAPVVMIEAPPLPDEARLYTILLETLYAPFKYSDSTDAKEAAAYTMLKAVGCRMLIIDEIHNLLAGSIARQKTVLNALKRLGNTLKISIVAVGTADAYRAIHTDPQLANRFRPVALPRWTIDDPDYARLLASIEQRLPLQKASHLTRDQLLIDINVLAEGLLGDIQELLTQCAIHAIRTGSECITAKTLRQVNWLPPSRRGDAAALREAARPQPTAKRAPSKKGEKGKKGEPPPEADGASKEEATTAPPAHPVTPEPRQQGARRRPPAARPRQATATAPGGRTSAQPRKA
jgi:hypothetical protein